MGMISKRVTAKHISSATNTIIFILQFPFLKYNRSILGFIMAALRGRCGHYIFVLFLSFFFFSSPNLRRRRLDVCHTSTHDVPLVRI